MNTFGKNFQQLRKSAHLTQDEVAKKVNVSAQAVSKWENGVSMPDITLLPLLADIFDISVDQLLGKSPKQAAPTREHNGEKTVSVTVDYSEKDKVIICLPVGVLKIFIDGGATDKKSKTQK